MTTDTEAKQKFWAALKSDMTVMLGRATEMADAQPMTAQLHDDQPEGPIWFFTAIDTGLVRSLQGADSAILTFADKGHALFATVHGSLQIHNDPAMIDALWNPFVAAWYEGKDDPKLTLLRFDPEAAQIWFDAKSLVAGIKMLLGIDPKVSYTDKTAQVRL